MSVGRVLEERRESQKRGRASRGQKGRGVFRNQKAAKMPWNVVGVGVQGKGGKVNRGQIMEALWVLRKSIEYLGFCCNKSFSQRYT